MSGHFSNSQFGRWVECEAAAYAHYVAKTYRFPTTDAMIAGSYLDVKFSGGEEKFIADHPEMFKKNGELLVKYSIIDEMFERVKRDQAFMAAMTGEKQVKIERELFGFNWLAYLDVVNHEKKYITDLKTTRDFEMSWDPDLKRKVPFYEKWNYWRQMAVYQKLAEEEFGEKYQLYIAVVTKQSPPDMAVLRFDHDQTRIDYELGVVKGLMPYFQDVKTGVDDPTSCGKCEYCRSVKKLDIELAKSYI